MPKEPTSPTHELRTRFSANMKKLTLSVYFKGKKMHSKVISAPDGKPFLIGEGLLRVESKFAPNELKANWEVHAYNGDYVTVWVTVNWDDSNGDVKAVGYHTKTDSFDTKIFHE